MPNNDYANEPNQSRSEDIIQSILDNTEYDEAARSRIEYLLIELKNAIEGGGGGGTVTSYSPLTEKPKIDNHTLQAGNNSSSDLGLQTKLTFDSAPTENSTNPVTSGAVYTALDTKANSSDVYTKSAVDTALTAKADKSTTYTKSDVDTALSSKQNTISDLSTIRSGAALGATAVQPETGKGLSTNDYTTAEKTKLAGIEAQANKTTVDSALSGSSTNPVQNKIVKSALDGKQATLTTAQLAAVNSGITAEKLTQDENNISWNTNNGVKNLSPVNNLTWVRTTGAGYTDYIDMNLPAGEYTLAYKLTTSANSAAEVTYDGSAHALFDSSAPYTNALCTHSFTATQGVTRLRFYFNQNATITDMMLVPKSLYDADPTYQPYALSNAELTAKEQINENNILLAEQMNGAKNIIQTNVLVTQYASGLTITNNNGKLILNGSHSGVGYVGIPVILKAGQYYLSGCPNGGSMNNYRVDLRLATGGDLYVDLGDTGEGFAFTVSSDVQLVYNIRIANGYTCNNLEFKPMIIAKSAYDAGFTDFQPYAMSNAELTNNISSLTPTVQYIRYTSTAANTYEDSGLSFVVPAGKICLYWAEVKYNASKPYGIVVSLGSPSTPNLIINKLESTEGLGALTITGIQLANSTTQDTTYNIFVKYADANKGNDVLLAYIII